MSNTINVNIDSFDEAMANDLLVLDFYTDTCQPCKQFMPIFEEFADKKFAGATYGKVNATLNQDLVGLFGVRTVPTIIVIRGGIEKTRKSGAISKADFETLILS